MDKENHDFVVYFASQKGTAENFASIIKRDSQSIGLKAKIVDLAYVTPDTFKNEKFCIFLMSTHYRGDPPDNAEKFWGWFSNEKLWPKDWLKGLKFTVFALGDKTYDREYAKVGQETNRLLLKYGADSIFKLGMGSDDKKNIKKHFKQWKDLGLLDVLGQNLLTKEKKEHSEKKIKKEINIKESYPFEVEKVFNEREKNLTEIKKSSYDLDFESERYFSYPTLKLCKNFMIQLKLKNSERRAV